MKYKLNPNKPYTPNQQTYNDHAFTWGYILLALRESATYERLACISRVYGRGANKGNTNFLRYLIKHEWIIRV